MNTVHSEIIKSCQDNLLALEKMSSLKNLQNRLVKLDEQINIPDLWNNPKKAGQLTKERAKIFEIIEYRSQAKEYMEFYGELIQTEQDGLNDKDTAHLLGINTKLHQMVFQEMMQEPIDQMPAIVSISAGAGGLESANWVSMLLRMYCRYAENQGFKTEILDKNPSEEHSSICTDSVSIRVDGNYAYGFFKGEGGVHRLIRNSPFNAGNARQTSFAAVSVQADIEDEIEVKIEDKDIEITAQCSSGPGGQNQNAVRSACRIKHHSTGINIIVRTERDFPANKKTALKMLKAKLYDLEVKKKQVEQDHKIAQQSDISFGHQIRTYTENPQAIVKDHRTSYEVRDFNKVLDGNIHEFMLAYLQSSHKST